jgi:hypothetical protein
MLRLEKKEKEGGGTSPFLLFFFGTTPRGKFLKKEKTMDQKEVALSVSKAILNGEWDKLSGILADDFTYTGDGMQFQ